MLDVSFVLNVTGVLVAVDDADEFEGIQNMIGKVTFGNCGRRGPVVLQHVVMDGDCFLDCADDCESVEEDLFGNY